MESQAPGLRAKIEELLQPLLEGDTYFVADLQVSDSRLKTKITVLLDSNTGILIEECARISRQLASRLEELNVIENAYTLEVSSPGVDFPLTLSRQYPRHVGRTLVVSLRDGSTLTGRLEAVQDDGLLILEEHTKSSGSPGKTTPGKPMPAPKKVLATEPTSVPFEGIAQSRVLVSFH